MTKQIEIERIYPLSPMQGGMLFFALMEPQSSAYHERKTFTIEGHIDSAALQNALQLLTEKHAVLRTRFVHEKVKRPMQIVLKNTVFNLHTLDLSSLPKDRKESGQKTFERREQQQRFNLVKEMPFRVSLVTVEPNLHKLYWCYHHIILDGWCSGLLFKELLDTYRHISKNQTPVRTPTRPYREYIEWLEKQDHTEGLRQWAQYLDGFETATGLPPSPPTPDTAAPASAEFFLSLEEPLTTAISDTTRALETTESAFCRVLWGLLLQQYNDTDDVVFGTVVSGRPPDLDGVEQMVGLFINTVPFRLRCTAQDTIEHLLRRGRDVSADFQPYEHLPLAEIQAEHPLKNRLLDHLLAFENYPLEEELNRLSPARDGFSVCRMEAREQTHYPLALAVSPGAAMGVLFIYDPKVYDASYIEQTAHRFRRLARQAAEQPRVTVDRLEIVSPEEKQQLLHDFNNTAADYPAGSTLHECVKRQAAQFPDRIAAADLRGHRAHEFLTYRRLDEASDHLAAHLAQKGIAAGHIVGLMSGRSAQLPAAMLGILKTGAAYMPIDPGYPRERIDYMLKDSAAQFLLTPEHITGEKDIAPLTASPSRFAPSNLPPVGQSGVQGEPVTDGSYYPPAAPRAGAPGGTHGPACITYTSGSTGKPKGAVIPHRGIVRLVTNTDYVSFEPDDRVLQVSTVMFDASTFEIWGALLNGSSLYIAPKGALLETYAAAMLKHNAISVMLVTPALFNRMAEADPGIFSTLRHLMVGGDVANPRRIREVRRACKGLRITNCYGPTENSVIATTYEIRRDIEGSIPIGKPIANSTAYILDRFHRLQPIGLPGELCLGGDGLALGYLNRPELTAEAFIRTEQRNPQAALYKTGDLARRLPDGNIQFLGRIDNQVKIRGFRIEPGEIQYRLQQHERISQAVVTAGRDDDGAGDYICAYYVSPEHIDTAQLKEFLAQTLPPYMLPTYMVYLDTLPMTPGGKIDKQRLPAPGETAALHQGPPPQSEPELQLARLWQEVLNLRSPITGTAQSFFHLGGHSLNAMQLLSAIKKQFGVSIPMARLFSHPTIAECAAYIKRSDPETFNPIQPAEEKAHYPLSSAQKRLFLLQQLDDRGTAYHITFRAVIEGEVHVQSLENAFKALIQRHESLRTSFTIHGEEPVQVIHAPESIDFKIETAAGASTPPAPFDLSQAPLLRVGFTRQAEQRHLLAVALHHIIADGESARLLPREFAQLYAGHTPEPPQLQYKDYAQWQLKQISEPGFKEQEAYWLKGLTPLPPVLDLPADFPRPPLKSFRGETIHLPLEPVVSRSLRALARDGNTTLFVLLSAYLYILCQKLSGREDIIIGAPVAARRHAGLETVMGMFAGTLALRRKPRGVLTVSQFLEDVKTGHLEALENQEYPFEMLVDQLAVTRDPGRNPLFDVMFHTQAAEPSALELPGLTITPLPEENPIAKFDLTVTAVDDGDTLELLFQYSTDLFTETTVRRFIVFYTRLLAGAELAQEALISQLDIIADEEKQKILLEFNDTEVPYPAEASIPTLFSEQVSRTPGKTAVTAIDETGRRRLLTYAQLDRLSDQTASRLLAEGTQPGDIVALYAEPSPDMIVALLGILKAGAAYLPINPNDPAEHIDYIRNDSDASNLPPAGQLGVQGAPVTDGFYYPPGAPRAGAPGGTPVYIMYTSGTTGRPKGVVVPHRAVVRLVKNNRFITLDSHDRIMQTGQLGFDASTFEIWGALLNGLSLTLVPKTVILTPDRLKAVIRDEHITVTWMTAPLFHQMVTADPEIFAGLRILLVGGDVVKPEPVNRVKQRFPGLTVINGYGPTENTTFSTTFTIEAEFKGPIPIGKPISNSTAVILDAYGNLQPIGVPGQLHVGGDGLALGYLNRPELTEERFIEYEATFDRTYLSYPQAALYNTGDIAKWLPDGNIQFLGRQDHQVKIRGFRIETAEIEHHLAQHQQVNEATVICRSNEDGTKYLAAYFTPNLPDTAPGLKEYLSSKLPGHMVPRFFIPMDQLPLTPNGKIDRRALPEPQPPEDTAPTAPPAPSTPAEEALTLAWQRLLKVPRVQPQDDFFALGGDSITAIQVAAALRKHGWKLDIKDLFLYPNVRDLGGHLKPIDRVIPQGPVSGDVPLTPIQHWFFREHRDHLRHFNQAVMLTREQGFEKKLLKQAFTQLARHHDALRMVYRFEPDGAVQFNRGIEEPLFDWVTYNVNQKEDPENFITQKAGALQRSMDPAQGPLLKPALFHTPNADHLLVVLHHLVVDGVSWRILLEDIASAYTSLLKDEPITLPEKTDSFQYWAQGLLHYAQSGGASQQQEYWQEVKNTQPGKLPTDFPPEPGQKPRSLLKTLRLELSPEETRLLLTRVHAAYNTEINDILLTALAMTLNQWTGSPTAAVTLEGHGRESILENVDISRTVGWFTTMYPVILEIDPQQDYGYTLKSTKETLRRVPSKGIGYGILQYLAMPPAALRGPLRGERQGAAPPGPPTGGQIVAAGIDIESVKDILEPEIVFNYLGGFDGNEQKGTGNENDLPFTVSQWCTGDSVSPNLPARHSLEISGMVVNGRLNLSFTYLPALFRESTIQYVKDLYHTHLTTLIHHCLNREESAYTPSDYGDTDLSIEELDEIEDMFEDM